MAESSGSISISLDNINNSPTIFKMFANRYGPKASNANDAEIKKISTLIRDGNERIQGKFDTGILLLGNTGAGKSTLAHVLMGVGLKAKYDDDTGSLQIEALQELEEIKMGHSMCSTTTIPNKCRRGDIVVWDCPGFNDTDVAQEIANSFYIKKLFEINAKLKFVFVVTEGELFQGNATAFVATVKQFIKCFSEIEPIINSASLVITHAESHRQAIQVQNKINLILQNNQGVNGQVKTLLNKIIENKALHLFHKPKEEGLIKVTDLFTNIQATSINLVADLQLVNIAISNDAKQYAKDLLKAAGNNFDDIVNVLMQSIVNPTKCMDAKDNPFIQKHALVESWVPDIMDYKKIAIKVNKSFFPILQQLTNLDNEFKNEIVVNDSPQITIENSIKLISNLLNAFRKNLVGNDYIELQNIIYDYNYTISQQFEYIKFFSEICEEKLEHPEELIQVMKLCKGYIEKSLSQYIESIQIKTSNEGGDFLLMSEAIEQDNSLVKENELYLKYDGTYVTCYKGAIHTGSVLCGDFSDKSINLDNLCEKISKQVFQQKILCITSKRGHTPTNEQQYYKEALKYLKVYPNIDSCMKNSALAYTELGLLAEQSSDKNLALKYFTKALSKDKNCIEVYEKLGNLFFASGEYGKAIMCYRVLRNIYGINLCFKTWQQQNPRDAEIMFQKAAYLEAIGRFDKSIGSYQNSASLTKDHDLRARALNEVANILENKLDFPKVFSQMAQNNEFYNFTIVNNKFLEQLKKTGAVNNPIIDISDKNNIDIANCRF